MRIIYGAFCGYPISTGMARSSETTPTSDVRMRYILRPLNTPLSQILETPLHCRKGRVSPNVKNEDKHTVSGSLLAKSQLRLPMLMVIRKFQKVRNYWFIYNQEPMRAEGLKYNNIHVVDSSVTECSLLYITNEGTIVKNMSSA